MVLMAATSSGQLRSPKVRCLLRSLFHLSHWQARRASHGGGEANTGLEMDMGLSIEELDMKIARLEELKKNRLALLKNHGGMRPRPPPMEVSVEASGFEHLASTVPALVVSDSAQRPNQLGIVERGWSSLKRIENADYDVPSRGKMPVMGEKPASRIENEDDFGRTETVETTGALDESLVNHSGLKVADLATDSTERVNELGIVGEGWSSPKCIENPDYNDSSGGEMAMGENLATGVENKDALVWTEMAENIETFNEVLGNISTSKAVEASNSAKRANQSGMVVGQGWISPRCIENANCDGSSKGEMDVWEKSTVRVKDKDEDVFVWGETSENIGVLNESFKLLNIVKLETNAKDVLKKIVDAEEKVRRVASETTVGNSTEKAKVLEEGLPNNAIVSTNECLLTFDDHTDADLIAKGLRMDHPWPEWREFLKDMSKKGYIKSIGEPDYTGEPMLSTSAVVRESGNLLGRERDDIFRFLSKPHIKVLAKFGCPSTSRKVVNAGKRLRKHCSVAEGDVCQHCNLKRSCTRAFSDSSPHVATGTLDIVRYVIPFALNRYPDVELHTAYPKEVEVAACGLLKEFVKYTARARDPDIPKAKVVSIPRSIKQPANEKGDQKETYMEERSTQKAYDDSRDWVCASCSFVNFARNRVCKNCSAFRPVKKRLLSDWDCLKCGYTNFFRNSVCYECKTIRPTMLEWEGGERRPINKTNKTAERNETSNLAQPTRHQTHVWHSQGQSQRQGQSRSQGRFQGQNLSEGQVEEWEESCESSEEGFWHEESDVEMSSSSRNDEDGEDLSNENRAYSGQDLKMGKGPLIGHKIDDDAKGTQFYLGRMNSS